MKTFYIKSKRKVLQSKKELEGALNVRISVGDGVSVSGKEEDEYFAERVLLALDFPFLVEDALVLKNDDYAFEIINIKDYTRRRDLGVVKGRIIGKKGNTLRILEELGDSFIAVKENFVAIIAPAENIDSVRQGIISLIHGAKQGNVYGYLEKSRTRKKRDS